MVKKLTINAVKRLSITTFQCSKEKRGNLKRFKPSSVHQNEEYTLKSQLNMMKVDLKHGCPICRSLRYCG